VSGGGGGGGTLGWEEVFDLYSFEYGAFSYGGAGLYCAPLGVDATAYSGLVTGWSKFPATASIDDTYSGDFVSASASIAMPVGLGVGGQYFGDPSGKIQGVAATGSVGVALRPLPASGSLMFTIYELDKSSWRRFHGEDKRPTYREGLQFAAFIMGKFSYPIKAEDLAIGVILSGIVIENGRRWEELRRHGAIS
jgi:hypothetical protein